MTSSAKPMGPIPPQFTADAMGELCIGGAPVSHWIGEAGSTPLFIYDLGIVRDTITALRRAMPPQLHIHYAMKANPHPQLLRAMVPMVDGIDVASAGELAVAVAAGADADHISFAGPGKRDSELEEAIGAGATINLESEGEAARALAIGARLSIRPRLAVRVNPDFDLKGSGMRMGGGAKPFGVDAERAPALVRTILDAGADWRGLHIFAGSQALDADAIAETQHATVALAARIAGEVGVIPPLVNLGGGLGVPYFANDRRLDLSQIGTRLGAVLDEHASALAGTQFAIELGRYLVAEAGIYCCRIVDRKLSAGELFLITDGGLHHQLAASGNFGTVIRRNYPVVIANKFSSPAAEVAQIVGCLCTPLDRLADQIAVPTAEVGDIVAVFLAGAYGASASPANFLGHPPPAELIVDRHSSPIA